MKNIFVFLVLSSLIVSCKSTSTGSKETASATNSQEADMTIYFKATGNEPFWGITLGKEQTIFTSLIPGKEKIIFSSVEPIKAMDANVKMYKLSNEQATATVTIQQVDCQDSMSGAISPYKVSIEIKNNAELESKKVEGCGK